MHHVLAFDYGTKNIGVAVGNLKIQSSEPLSRLRAKDGIPNWEEISKLIAEWQPSLLVVGLPLNMDGSESEMSKRARKFGARLHGRFGVKVAFCDERLSSHEAKSNADALGHRGNYGEKPIDDLAASIILRDWLAAEKQ